MMDRYLAQCADEAFKALLTDEDLETRLNTAAMHLGIPNDSQVDTASQDVRSALADVRSNRNDPCPNRASAIRLAIEQILREFAVERSRSEVAIAADFPKAVKQEKELKDKTVKKILVSDTDAAIKNANLFFAQGDDVVADKVQVIESMVPGYKVGRDAENSVTPESLARGIQALNTFLKKQAEKQIMRWSWPARFCPDLKRERQRVESQERRFQFKKCRQKLVGFDNEPAAIATMCIDYPAPALWANGTIAPGETRCTELVSDDSQYFMESLPFSSPDEFPTPRNLSACFFDLNDRQAHGQYHKMPCPSP